MIVETYGKPMVVLLPYSSYQEYLVYKQQQQAERRLRFAALRQLAAQQAGAALPLSDVDAEALIVTTQAEVSAE